MSLRRRWNYENTVSVVVCYVSTGESVVICFFVFMSRGFLLLGLSQVVYNSKPGGDEHSFEKTHDLIISPSKTSKNSYLFVC